MRGYLALLFFVVSLIALIYGSVKLIDKAVSPIDRTIGPHITQVLESDQRISSKGSESVTFTSSCNFVLMNLDNYQITAPEVIEPQIGERYPHFEIKNFNLDGRYVIQLCGATVYSEKETIITTENGLPAKTMLVITIVFVFFVVLALVIAATVWIAE